MRLSSFMPSEPLTGKPRIILTGNEALLIEQHRGVISYTQDRLIVRLRQGRLNVLGQAMQLQEYGKQDLCVNGEIISLEFVP
ncbi:MAG: YabP/YqfC family sporulation protein [Clostridia bacterium]|nr:YabP/YqfC family sporulation protein [Clostridia bacterium]